MDNRFAIALMFVGGALAACSRQTSSPPSPEPLAEALFQAAVVEDVPRAEVAAPDPQFSEPRAAPVDEPEPEAPTVIEEVEPEPPPRLGGGELSLLTEIPILRSDFGVRFAFSPTEDVLLHSGAGLFIQRVDWERSRSLEEIAGFVNFPPITISLSPDGSTIVADDGPLIRVWDLQSGSPMEQLELSPFSTIIDAGFQSENVYFAVDYFGNVALWDPSDWGEIARFSSPGRIDSGLLFPNGDTVALQDRDRREVLILDLRGQNIGSVPILDQHAQLLFGSPAGDRILLHVNRGFPSEGIKVLDVLTGETLLELPMLNFRYFAISDEWDLLAGMDVFNRLRIHSLPEGELLLEQEFAGVTRTLGLAMSPNGNHLAAYVLKGPGEGSAIQIWGAHRP